MHVMNPLQAMIIAPLLKTLEQDRSPAELWEALEKLEHHLPARNTCPDIPYLLAPPTLSAPETWLDQLAACGFPAEPLRQPLQSGLSPLDVDRFGILHGGENWLEPLTKRKFVPVDPDYGVVSFAEASPDWANVSLTRHILERYARLYPELERDQDLFLSLGSLRLRKLLPERFKHPTYEPATLVVDSRAELDRLLHEIRSRLITVERYQMWFRGQNDDVLLRTISEKASLAVCPWRSKADSSLVPKLYRELSKRLEDVRRYALFCREYALYSLFLESQLNESKSTEGKPGEPAQEMLDDE